MRITVVSRSWPSHEHSGVAIAAADHVRILVDQGHMVSIIGSNPAVLDERLPVSCRYYVPANGSGALYSPCRINKDILNRAIDDSMPDLLIIEAWQTALTDNSIDLGFKKFIPILMVSHGVAVHPFSLSFTNQLRSLAWLYYRVVVLPKRINRLSAITTLDGESLSKRFYDRMLAQKMGIPVITVVNTPCNWMYKYPMKSQRKLQILVVGYFSEVKNQLQAINVLSKLPEQLCIRFVGQRKGSYYKKCVEYVEKLSLASRVKFSEDNECDLAEEVACSLAVFSTSITEALPLVLLEAMASGTPFVATSVGAVKSLKSGFIAGTIKEQCNALLKLYRDDKFWAELSRQGRVRFEKDFRRENIAYQLDLAVNAAINSACFKFDKSCKL